MTGGQVLDKAKSEGRSVLTEIEAKELLKQAGISVVDTKLATSKEEAISIREGGLSCEIVFGRYLNIECRTRPPAPLLSEA